MKKTIRLVKFLSHMGFGTRSQVKKLIRQKRVGVDGKITNKLDTSVCVDEQKVTMDGKEVKYSEYFYFIMNKPQGVISATTDNMHKTVMDLLNTEDKNKELFPVGRLDIDTEGLLIITNDGKLSHSLLSPKKHVPKTYYAQVEGIVTPDDVQKFRQGITLEDGYVCMPAHLTIIQSDRISEVELTIEEGKFHQVKRMMLAVGKEVIYLQRIRMGDLKLPEDIEIGKYRAMSQDEKDILLRSTAKTLVKETL